MKIQDIYYLERLDQLQALSDPLRYRMIALLCNPKTCAQLGRELGIDRAKAHYHLKQLERVGLVRLHSTDEVQGITEKYYIVLGRLLDFSKLMPKQDDLPPNDVTLATFKSIATFLATMLDVSRDSIMHSADDKQAVEGCWFDFEAKLTQTQFDTFKEKIRALRNELIEVSGVTETETNEEEQISTHTTLYLSRINK